MACSHIEHPVNTKKSGNNRPKTGQKLAQIGQNWSKLGKIGQKSHKSAQNLAIWIHGAKFLTVLERSHMGTLEKRKSGQKSAKIRQNPQKSDLYPNFKEKWSLIEKAWACSDKMGLRTQCRSGSAYVEGRYLRWFGRKISWLTLRFLPKRPFFGHFGHFWPFFGYFHRCLRTNCRSGSAYVQGKYVRWIGRKISWCPLRFWQKVSKKPIFWPFWPYL